MPVGIYQRKPFTQEHINNISKALQGKNNRGNGWHHSEETRLKMSQSKKKIDTEYRLKLSRSMKGNLNSWRGGKHKSSRGYIMVLAIRYGVKKYWLEHRLVMEDFLGRQLKPYEAVHHKNGIKSDNRISNLQLMVGFFHSAEIRCPHCLKQFLVQ